MARGEGMCAYGINFALWTSNRFSSLFFSNRFSSLFVSVHFAFLKEKSLMNGRWRKCMLVGEDTNPS